MINTVTESLQKKLFGDQQLKIAIIPHERPDGDAIGSSLALYHFFNNAGHHAKVIAPNSYPNFLKFLPQDEYVWIYEQKDVQLACNQFIAAANIIVFLDFNTLTRITESLAKQVENNTTATTILIDHHLQPQIKADYIIWDNHASSTAELVFVFLDTLKHLKNITPDIANCIYTGIASDTGRFKHNTNPQIFEIASQLLKYGANLNFIHNALFNNYTESRIRLFGFAISQKMEVMNEYATAIIHLSHADLQQFDYQIGDTENLVNDLLTIKNVNFGVLIVQRADVVKLSLRSKGSFSVNDFARTHFEGGGHLNAAGGKSILPLAETVETLKNLLPQYQTQLLNALNSSL